MSLSSATVFSDDYTSSFKGKGKVRPHKKQLERNPRFHKAFRQIGDDWNVKTRVMKQLEQFTYLVYGHISKSSVNAGHFKLPHKMVREDNKHIFQVQSRPVTPFPYLSTLEPHIKHVNHRLALCK